MGLVVKRRSCTRTASRNGSRPCSAAAAIKPSSAFQSTAPPRERWPGRASSRRSSLAVIEDEAGFVQTPAAGAAEHLQDFVGAQQLFAVVAAVGFGGQGDAAQGEIDARGQAHRGHDDAQLAGLGQRFDRRPRAPRSSSRCDDRRRGS